MTEQVQVSLGSALAESVFQRYRRRQWPYWYTHGLPNARNSAGRPVWEPPILDRSEWIGEAYEKKREAMLKFLKGDKARTTDLMDIEMEKDLLEDYLEWSGEEWQDARGSRAKIFFHGLYDEVEADFFEVSSQWADLGAYSFHEKDDGTYEVVSYDGDGAYCVYSNTIDDPPRPMTLAGVPIIGEEQPPEYKLHLISSPNDETKEVARLDGLDASLPPSVSSRAPSEHKSTPLALRLLSLRSSSANQITGKTEEKYIAFDNDDDLD